MDTNYLGIQDTPVTDYNDDKFNISAYTDSLAEFVTTCNTPMTIAVQGDWGCGKTSMMNMVKSWIENEDKDNARFKTIWFNTWYYSQFNMAELLPATFTEQLISKMLPEENSKGIKETINTFTSFLRKGGKFLGTAVTEKFVGTSAAEDVRNALSAQQAIPDMAELRDEFNNAVQQLNTRQIIFIDDLDRIEPARAVEILELIKILFDCPNCVFILAIDTSVVYQGIRTKYGENMSNNKAQSFFEKLIQMPFKMPISHYNYAEYLNSLGEYDFIKTLNQIDSMTFMELIKLTLNSNPRNIKRAMNTYTIFNKIANKNHIYDNLNETQKYYAQLILMSLVCIQSRFPYFYDIIVNCCQPDTPETLLRYLTDDIRKGNGITYSYEEDLIKRYGMNRIAISKEEYTKDQDTLIATLKKFYAWCSKLGDTAILQSIVLLKQVGPINNSNNNNNNLSTTADSQYLVDQLINNSDSMDIVDAENMLNTLFNIDRPTNPDNQPISTYIDKYFKQYNITTKYDYYYKNNNFYIQIPVKINERRNEPDYFKYDIEHYKDGFDIKLRYNLPLDSLCVGLDAAARDSFITILHNLNTHILNLTNLGLEYVNDKKSSKENTFYIYLNEDTLNLQCDIIWLNNSNLYEPILHFIKDLAEMYISDIQNVLTEYSNLLPYMEQQLNIYFPDYNIQIKPATSSSSAVYTLALNNTHKFNAIFARADGASHSVYFDLRSDRTTIEKYYNWFDLASRNKPSVISAYTALFKQLKDNLVTAGFSQGTDSHQSSFDLEIEEDGVRITAYIASRTMIDSFMPIFASFAEQCSEIEKELLV